MRGTEKKAMTKTTLQESIALHLTENVRSQAGARMFPLMDEDKRAKVISDIVEIGLNPSKAGRTTQRCRMQRVINNALATFTDVRIDDGPVISILVNLVHASTKKPLEELLRDVLSLGMRLNDGTSVISGLDPKALSTLIQHIIDICRAGHEENSLYILLAQEINRNILFSHPEYRVTGHRMLKSLVHVVNGGSDPVMEHRNLVWMVKTMIEEYNDLNLGSQDLAENLVDVLLRPAVPAEETPVAEKKLPGEKMTEANCNVLVHLIAQIVFDAGAGMDRNSCRTMAQRIVHAIEDQVLYPLRGTIPQDIINAQMFQVKKLVEDRWPEDSPHRDIITGELASMMLNVFESGRQLGRQEARKVMQTALAEWEGGE